MNELYKLIYKIDRVNDPYTMDDIKYLSNRYKDQFTRIGDNPYSIILKCNSNGIILGITRYMDDWYKVMFVGEMEVSINNFGEILGPVCECDTLEGVDNLLSVVNGVVFPQNTTNKNVLVLILHKIF